jgi:hypothetical protein
VSEDPAPPSDVTWDNFSAVPEPGIGLLASLPAAAATRRRRKG